MSIPISQMPQQCCVRSHKALSLWRHVLISPFVVFMYKQHIPVRETGMENRIRAQLPGCKVRGEGIKKQRERKRKHTRAKKLLDGSQYCTEMKTE